MKRMLFSFLRMLAVLLTFTLVLAGCNTLQSIEITNEPAQTVYGQGQDLSLSGMVVTGLFKKDSRNVTSQVRISGYNKDRPGQQTVTVTMNAGSKSSTATFTVTVVPVENISISQLPSTTSFKQGEEHNWNGLSIRVQFENDAVPSEIVTPGARTLTITGYEKDKPGTQTITVDYYGKRATFEIRVVGLDSITVTNQPTKTEYYTGEEIDLTGIVVQGTWSDGSTARVNITNTNLSGFDITRGERQNVIVTYSGKTTTFPVTYIAFSALSVDRPPTKTKYEMGEALDITGIRILGTWPGNSLALVDRERLRITGYDPLRQGEQRITVTVAGKSDTFTVTVTNPFEGTWSGQWTQQVYVNGQYVSVVESVFLKIDANAWSLQTRKDGNDVSFRGVCTYESNTKAKLQCDDSRGRGEVNRDSPTAMRLKIGFFSTEIALRK
jgi:cytochrome c-type biogenesis protein CcmE